MRRMPNTAPVKVPELQVIGDVATANVHSTRQWEEGSRRAQCSIAAVVGSRRGVLWPGYVTDFQRVVGNMRCASHRLLPTISIALTLSALGLVIATALF